MNPLLEVEGLTVTFGGARALDEVTFTLEAGTAMAVVGANGSGKTTLLNALSGTVPATGRIRCAATDTMPLPGWIRARGLIARTLQRPSIFPRLTPHENLAIARWVAGQPRAHRAAGRVLQVIRAVRTPLAVQLEQGKPPLPDNPAWLQVERAFATGTSVVLLDEPLAGQPAVWHGSILARVAAHKEKGGAAIVVEHHIDAVLPAIERILELERGRVSFLGSREAYLQRRNARANGTLVPT